MKVRPLADRVLVKVDKVETKTASGIIIPDTAQEKTQTAVVVAVGDDKEKIKVSVGQKVMHDKYAGTQIKIDGEEYLILKAGDTVFMLQRVCNESFNRHYRSILKISPNFGRCQVIAEEYPTEL